MKENPTGEIINKKISIIVYWEMAWPFCIVYLGFLSSVESMAIMIVIGRKLFKLRLLNLYLGVEHAVGVKI